MSDQADERDQIINTTPAEQNDDGRPEGRSGATAARLDGSDQEHRDGDARVERTDHVEADGREDRVDDRTEERAADRSEDRQDDDPLETREREDPEVRETASTEDTDEEATTDSEPEKDPEQEAREEEERKRAAEEFAAEHDPAKHDLNAGEDFRQRGDWTADKAGEPQVWDAEGNLVEGSEHAGTLEGDAVEQSDSMGAGDDQSGQGADHAEHARQDGAAGGDSAPDGRRVSSLEEVTDGGYSVGSAAPIDDGAMPLGHPVKAWNDTKSFLTPGSPGYESGEPQVWFSDASAAEAAGFRHAQ